MNTLFETGQPRYTLHQGDSREVLKTLADNSVDSIVCDPPYELGFMGRSWDNTGIANDVTLWREALRVAKPGAWLLAFGGTRTFHRMACAIEDAGWELRDAPVRGHMHQPEDCPWLMGWMYGSGFPKSHNGDWGGTALKPAWEPIVCARKPLIGTVAENWAAHGTGALNIDACRIGTEGGSTEPSGMDRYNAKLAEQGYRPAAYQQGEPEAPQPAGRWPANLIHDGSPEVLAHFPYTASGTGAVKRSSSADESGNTGAAFGAESRPAGTPMICHGDEGSAARFFYCAKASPEDRHEGLPHPGPQFKKGSTLRDAENLGADRKGNHHPTVKPTDLMAYLCRLVTPPGGIVMDPFMGSGSTGKAAMLEGFNFIGIDLSAEYIEIARARIDHALRQGHQPSLLEAA